MPRNVTKYSLLISCPGDVQEEVKIIGEVVLQFNTLYSDALGIEVTAKHWSKNSYPNRAGSRKPC